MRRRRRRRNRTGVIVGRALANRFGWSVGDRVPLLSPIWSQKGGGRDWAFDISAIYDAAEDGVDTSQMFIRYDYMDEARPPLLLFAFLYNVSYYFPFI